MRHPVGKDNKNPKAGNATPAAPASRRHRPILILLNLIIIALVVTGVWLMAEPYYLHWRQDSKTADLIKAVENGSDQIVLFADDLKVPGEDEEFVDEVEAWDTESPSSGSESTATESGTPASAGTSVQPVGSKGPTPTPKPTQAQVVVKAIGQLIIDKINLKMPIADRAEAPQLRVAVGLLGGSSLPGTPGNSIILGHRMYTYGRHFNRLDEVVAGTPIVILTTTGRRITYTVDRQETVLPADLRTVLTQPTKEKQLILVTCTPVRIASHRLLVYCRQISDEKA